LLLAAIRQARKYGKSAPAGGIFPREKIPFLLRTAPWGLLLVFMAKVGTFENARHLAPYYAFLFPIFLVRPGHSQVVRHREWQKLGLMVMSLTIALLMSLSERPLFPAKTLCTALRAKFSDSAYNEFIFDEYSHYFESCYQLVESKRNYLKQALPPDEKVIGYAAGILDVDEPAIWMPYGRRRVECLLPDDSLKRLQSLGIHYVVLDATYLRQTGRSLRQWLDKYNASLIGQHTFIRQSAETEIPPDLYLVRLN
jgi:hypothetical protein